jgi:hypothetical protein
MAAQMLERAGRWREAARVYRERLRVAGKAAGCYESAGLLSEAVVAWREAFPALRDRRDVSAIRVGNRME